MITTNIGQKAEKRVAKKLKEEGYKILALNWKTKVCEIDIIASKRGIMYFVEVKYRGKDLQGSGLEYITPSKLRKVYFAAEVWATQNNWLGDYRVLGAEVSNNNIAIIEID